MVACLFYNTSAEAIAEAVNLGTDTLKLMATNVAHSASAVNKADVTELSVANGYTGPVTVTVASSSSTGSTYKLVLNSPAAWTLTGSITLRGLVLYSDTAVNKPLICRWNLATDGSAVTLTPPTVSSLGIQFDATAGVLTIEQA